MLLIIGTVRLPPDKVAEAKPAMERMIHASRAEDGCLAYSYAIDVLDAGLVHVREIWRDQATLDAHAASSHLAEWRATWPALGVTDRALVLHEVDKGRSI